MAGKVAALPTGSRITDFLSFGILARAFPIAKVHEALAATGKTSRRQRDLPAHVVVYYVLALSLYMQASSREVLRCLLEGLQWLRLGAPVSIAGKSGMRARERKSTRFRDISQLQMVSGQSTVHDVLISDGS